MKQKLKNNEVAFKFNWLGFFALLIGIEYPLLALGYLFMMPIPSLILQSMIVVSPVLLIICIKHYNWRNTFLAVVLIISAVHPIRFLSYWWENPAQLLWYWWLAPIFYGLLTMACLLILIQMIHRNKWKNGVSILLAICIFFSGMQSISSTLDVGHCIADDFRYTDYYYCEGSSSSYQQIQSLPIGMKGWCYWCPWHRGVGW